MIRLFQHLLPRAAAWSITIDKNLRRLFGVFGDDLSDLREYLELIWFDLFASTTREITMWEAQFGLPDADLDDAARRSRLDATWKATGGQSPRYIQDTLQAAGFPVYIHEWWVPGTDPPVARNPNVLFGEQLFGCGDAIMECGEDEAQCGNGYAAVSVPGYALVNKLYYVSGDELVRVEYALDLAEEQFPFCFYVGGETFGDLAVLPASRKEEFEDLLLKICPAQQWIIILVDFTVYLIEGSTGDRLIEGSTSDILTEG